MIVEKSPDTGVAKCNFCESWGTMVRMKSPFGARGSEDAPGLIGQVRLGRDLDKVARRARAGDLIVINESDISRHTAQQLIDLEPGAVINAAAFTTGDIPNLGPTMLAEAGITLVESTGTEVFTSAKDGKKGRLYDGKLFHGDRRVAAGTVRTPEDIAFAFDAAQQSLLDHIESFIGNTTEFVRSEVPLLIDGLGIPDIDVPVSGRKAVVVGHGPRSEQALAQLKSFIKEFDPLLVGVEQGAELLRRAGYVPDIILGNPEFIDADTLRSGAQVVLPAAPDGHTPGLERIQDLGVGAMTFPTACDSAMDMALLLLHHHGASLIVNAGPVVDLDTMFDQKQRVSAPSAVMTRLRAGKRYIDADAVAELYRVPSSGLAIAWAIFGVLAAIATIILIAAFTTDGSLAETLSAWWSTIAGQVGSWFN